jgi:hypothetical protein
VAVNLTGDTIELDGADAHGLAGLVVELATDSTLEGRPFAGSLPADGAVVVALPRHPA